MTKLQFTAFVSVFLLFTLFIGCKDTNSSQSTPDLMFHELQGDVKKVAYRNHSLTFDEDGNWTNEPDWDSIDIKTFPEDERFSHPKVIRGDDGYINRIYNGSGSDVEYEEMKWKDGKLLERNDGAYVKYEYNTDGYIIFSEEDASDYGYVCIYTYCNYVIDEMGNWVERDVVIRRMDIVSSDESYACNHEARSIEYYNSNGGNLHKVQNGPLQNQALKDYWDYIIK